MKRKFTIVSYPIGRVGSSAVMGLLSLMGISLGPSEVSQIKGKYNPKGFFESNRQNALIKSIFPDIYSTVKEPPDIDIVLDLAMNGKITFEKLIEEQPKLGDCRACRIYKADVFPL